jgi:hypothetical protein
MTRFVRTLVPIVMLGLVGFLFGCSGQQTPAPTDKATVKKIGEEFKKARLEEQKERQANKARAKMRGRVPDQSEGDGRPAAPGGGSGREEKR